MVPHKERVPDWLSGTLGLTWVLVRTNVSTELVLEEISDTFLAGRESARDLGLVEDVEHCSHCRSRLDADSDQVAAHHERRRGLFCHFQVQRPQVQRVGRRNF